GARLGGHDSACARPDPLRPGTAVPDDDHGRSSRAAAVRLPVRLRDGAVLPLPHRPWDPTADRADHDEPASLGHDPAGPAARRAAVPRSHPGRMLSRRRAAGVYLLRLPRPPPADLDLR